MSTEVATLLQFFALTAVFLFIPFAFFAGIRLSVRWAIRLVLLCILLILAETFLLPAEPFDLARYIENGTLPAQRRITGGLATLVVFLLIYIAIARVLKVFKGKSPGTVRTPDRIGSVADVILIFCFGVTFGISATQAIGLFLDGSSATHLLISAFAGFVCIASAIYFRLLRRAYFFVTPFFFTLCLLMAFGGLAFPSIIRNAAETVAQGNDWCLLKGPDFASVPDTDELLFMNIPKQDLLVLVVQAPGKPSYWRWSKRGLAFKPLGEVQSAICPLD